MSATLPNLIILGAMKSGTTSLHDYLNQHPGINMSSFKEPDYFVEEKNWDKGLDWYKSYFDSTFKINGESSQNYTKRHYFKGVDTRLADVIKDCKFIYIVRDPLKRIESHYRENQFDTGFAEGLNATLENNLEHNWVQTSRYYFQLVPFLNHFPKENFHVLTLESLDQDLQKEMSKIFTFLGVEDFIFSKKLEVSNDSSQKKAVSAFGRFLRSAAVRSLVSKIPSGLKNTVKKTDAFQKSINTDIVFEKLSETNKSDISKYLKEDVEQLQKAFNLDIESWSEFNVFRN